jgi:uroporphyrinogen III methyltransferase / synthase
VKPLAGRRVLVTRPREQAAELSEQLTAAGAEALAAPLIRIEAPSDPRPLRDAAARAHAFDWVVLTSANAVDALVSAGFDAARGAKPRFCAVGPATAAQLQKHGLSADLVAGEARAEGVIAALTASGSIGGASVLIPRADIGRDVIGRALTDAGARVTEVVAYQTVAAQRLPDDVLEALEAGRVDVTTFTSGSAVRAMVGILGDRTRPLLDLTAVAVIGPTTADAARQAGLTVTIQPAQYTVPALVEAIAAHFHAG